AITAHIIFMAMKKTLPVIVILTTLSLLGLILLQASWLSNLITLRQEQLNQKVNEAGTKVALELSNGATNKAIIKLPKRLGIGRFNSISLLKPITIDERYTKEEIHQKLQDAFHDAGIDFLKFEFAITNSNGEIEMQTADFLNQYADSLHNKQKWIAIAPETATELEGLGAIENLAIVVPDFKQQVWGSLRWVIAGAAFFMLIIITAFYVTLKTLFNQKKLSEIKSDFINNMTHEFKTPLATISLAVDALRNEKVQANKEKLTYFTGIIKEENKRMNKHVETILEAAVADKQDLKLNFQPFAIHDALEQVIEAFQLQLNDKNGKVSLQLNAANQNILADEIHFTNLLSNLIDNAIKYSNEPVAIQINTKNSGKNLILTITDNGIGMNKESVKRIFEKFYRAHTGNVHNVKGFGLGMSYVKSVIDAHKGKIKVDSTLGKGTTFTLELPVTNG
ncbi:MAG: sensor histidine kinase, partial [Chitinophagaceae bacterium]